MANVIKVPASPIPAMTPEEVAAAAAAAAATPSRPEFSLMRVFSAEQLAALESLLSANYDGKALNAMEATYKGASLAELFIITKMQELADKEMVASVWRAHGIEWKATAASNARLLFHEDKSYSLYARKSIVNLRDVVPADKWGELAKHVIKSLDKGSEDARVLEFTRILKSGETVAAN